MFALPDAVWTSESVKSVKKLRSEVRFSPEF
jgi:hypothetical protein